MWLQQNKLPDHECCWGGCRYSKPLSLLYLTLALVWVGGLGIFAVTGESLYDAFWQVAT